MSFSAVRAGAWTCDFFEENLFTRVGRQRTFGSAEKIRELVARTPTRMVLEDRQALDYALGNGRGAVWLEVTAEQYRKLQG